jgi:hypothetical protein
MSTVQEIHERILNDIRLRTGLRCRHVQGIDTSEESVARVVLPILAEWVPFVGHWNMRAAVYTRFTSKHAAPFLASMVEWAKKEENPFAIDCLNFALGTAVQEADAERLWRVMPELPKSPNYYHIVAKLAAFPQVSAEAKAWLDDAMRNGSLGLTELRAISEVDDPRFFAWFAAMVDAPDKRIRALARKVVDRGKRLPKDVQYAAAEPGRAGELFSTEVDLDEIERLLRELARDHELKIPPSIRTGRFLSRLPLDRWVVGMIPSQRYGDVQIYFRLEDFDTVEVVVLPGKSAKPNEVLQ